MSIQNVTQTIIMSSLHTYCSCTEMKKKIEITLFENLFKNSWHSTPITEDDQKLLYIFFNYSSYTQLMWYIWIHTKIVNIYTTFQIKDTKSVRLCIDSSFVSKISLLLYHFITCKHHHRLTVFNNKKHNHHYYFLHCYYYNFGPIDNHMLMRQLLVFYEPILFPRVLLRAYEQINYVCKNWLMIHFNNWSSLMIFVVCVCVYVCHLSVLGIYNTLMNLKTFQQHTIDLIHSSHVWMNNNNNWVKVCWCCIYLEL